MPHAAKRMHHGDTLPFDWTICHGMLHDTASGTQSQDDRMHPASPGKSQLRLMPTLVSTTWICLDIFTASQGFEHGQGDCDAETCHEWEAESVACRASGQLGR